MAGEQTAFMALNREIKVACERARIRRAERCQTALRTWRAMGDAALTGPNSWLVKQAVEALANEAMASVIADRHRKTQLGLAEFLPAEDMGRTKP